MLSVAKDLAVSKTVDRHVDLEIFRFAQDDMVVVCHAERSEESPRRLHIEHIINRHPEEGIINEQLVISNVYINERYY